MQPPVDIRAPEAVEVAVREGEGRKAVFLLNYSDQSQTAHLGLAAYDPLTGAEVTGDLVLPPYSVRVLQVR